MWSPAYNQVLPVDGPRIAFIKGDHVGMHWLALQDRNNRYCISSYTFHNNKLVVACNLDVNVT